MRDSVMICSEFAGCNEAMRGVLRYNPFALTGFTDQMDIAMTLTANQREQRMNQCYSHI
jgi:trehalose-6-phosphate synthase